VGSGTARSTTKASVNGNRRFPIETQTRHLIRKGATFMAKRPPPVQAGAVSDAQTRTETENALNALLKLEKESQIENVLNARRKLKEAIEEFKKQRAVGEAELTELVRYLASASLSVETAIATYESWKGKYEPLEENMVALEKVLSVIDEHINELKKE
jgi:chromosome segregation ATPase